jgi:uncharacterized protein (DUF1015 family)
MISTIKAPHILLPRKGVDMSKYAVIACDQYTSNLEYWDTLKDYVGDEVSTFHMIYPEAYLENTDSNEYIKNINLKINKYLDNKDLVDIGECFILVERVTSYGVRRLGLILSIDLEDYSYEKGNKASIKASEATIVERIPPRLKIRKDAGIELPHVLVLFDDKEKTIVEELYKNRDRLEKVYDFELNKDGGHICGYKVSNTSEIIKKFDDLYNKNGNGLLFIVGDGNHSLATAKAHWDLVKQNLSEEEKKGHPARFALVEANNLYDEGIIFEPIHRVLFNVDDSFLDELKKITNGDFVSFTYSYSRGKEELRMDKNAPKAYKTIQTFLDSYMKEHPEVKIDFIHDEDELISVSNKNPHSIAIAMPALTKDDLFDYIAGDLVLPRKSFSMGHANEKRYYLEAKKIVK